MTKALPTEEVAHRLQGVVRGAVERCQGGDIWVRSDRLLEVCRFLKEDPQLCFDYLAAITGVDYIEYFEMVYHLVSIRLNHGVVVKTKLFGRESPAVPSVVSVWKGADLQEREVWDLMGIAFEGHPNLKRVLTWEGFPGHPLRKDFLG